MSSWQRNLVAAVAVVLVVIDVVALALRCRDTRTRSPQADSSAPSTGVAMMPPSDTHAAQAPVSRWRGTLAVAVFFVAGVGVQLFRASGTTDRIWAEDGGLYATQVYALPAVRTLVTPYAGYVQFVPRVLALGARGVPVTWLASYEAIVAAVAWTLLALFVHRSTAGWIRSPWLRWLLAAFVVASPSVAIEADANLANLGWVFVVAAFWAVVSQRGGTVDVVLRGVVVALAALTTPVTVILVPVATVVFLRRRTRADAWIAAGALTALAVQAYAVRTTAPAGTRGPWTVSDVVTDYGVRAVAATVFGERWLESLWLTYGYTLVAVAAASLVLLAVVSARRSSADHRLLAAGATLTSMLASLFTVVGRGSTALRITTSHFETSSQRYYVVPILLLVTAVVALADASPRRWVASTVVVWGVALLVLHLGQPTGRSVGPSWARGIDKATNACRTVNRPDVVHIPISPPGWFVTVPCRRLTGRVT